MTKPAYFNLGCGVRDARREIDQPVVCTCSAALLKVWIILTPAGSFLLQYLISRVTSEVIFFLLGRYLKIILYVDRVLEIGTVSSRFKMYKVVLPFVF